MTLGLSSQEKAEDASPDGRASRLEASTEGFSATLLGCCDDQRKGDAMKYPATKIAGSLLFVGAAQFMMGMLVAEALYPGYSVSQNYISDLGATCNGSCTIVQPSSTIFNLSVIGLGVLGIVGAYFIWSGFRSVSVSSLFAVAAIGAMGVGLFPETTGIYHSVFSLITFLFAGASAIASSRLQRAPLSYFSVLLGGLTFVALALFMSRNYLGLGPGGMERMIVYPVLIWLLGFGGLLIAHPIETSKRSAV